MFWYIVMFIVGVLVAVLCPHETIEEYSLLMSGLVATALIASMLVPFAGFTKKEKALKWCVQNGVIPIFGVLAVYLFPESITAEEIAKAALGYMILIASISVHMGYWMSSIHSRAYRLKQFLLMMEGTEIPKTRRTIARWNIAGQQDLTDGLVTAVIEGRVADLQSLLTQDRTDLAEGVIKEMNPYRCREEQSNSYPIEKL